MKKAISAVLSMFFAISLCSGVFASATSAPGLSNFEKVNTYTSGQYTDVPSTSWCAENVKTAYEYGIMQGTTDTLFDTDGNLTIAQTIAIASRIHSIYCADDYPFAVSDPWYKTYIDYAVDNGIVSKGYGNYDSNYSSSVSRAGFALILNGALPDEALQSISSVQDESIPDVTVGSNYYDAVYRLYRAGVLTGNDLKGTFAPFSKITRGAAAAIVSRMANMNLRKSITLKVSQYPTAVSLSVVKQTLYQGKGFGLTASITPFSVTENAITWSSSNRSVAAVDTQGYVYGVAPGTATITAKTTNGKTATCVVTVVTLKAVSHSNTYGTVKGSITWQYNQYIGTKPDVGADILLLPYGVNTTAYDNNKPAMLQGGNADACIYYGQADGYGSYEIDKVPTGIYKILVISNKTTAGWRFNDPTSWKYNLEGDLAAYFSSKDMKTLELMIGYSSYTISTVTVTANSTTTYSHDFGYTYL